MLNVCCLTIKFIFQKYAKKKVGLEWNILISHFLFQQRLQMFEEEEQQAKDAWSFRKQNHLLTINKYQSAFRVLPLGEDRFVV